MGRTLEDNHLKPGTLLQGGKYRIVRFISSGGFGCTYEAIHTVLESRVAIKEFFVKDFCNRDEGTSRISVATDSKRDLVAKLKKKFIEEAKAIFSMHHEGIVRVIDIFEENGTAYYVMDFIDGRSLHDIVKQEGPMSEKRAIGYILQVCDALEYVHSKNRLHLDIKPGNIMIDKNDKAVLIDFGASKHYDEENGENTSTLLGVNTKGYAPVEQSTQSFTTFNPATDIYSLGATLYKLLSGITPPDSILLLSEEETLQPLPPTVSANTRKVVAKAMSMKRRDRYQTVKEFADALKGKSSTAANNDDAEVTSFEPEVKRPATEQTQIKATTSNTPSNSSEADSPKVKFVGKSYNYDTEGNSTGVIIICAIVAIAIIAIAIFSSRNFYSTSQPTELVDSDSTLNTDTDPVDTVEAYDVDSVGDVPADTPVYEDSYDYAADTAVY